MLKVPRHGRLVVKVSPGDDCIIQVRRGTGGLTAVDGDELPTDRLGEYSVVVTDNQNRRLKMTLVGETTTGREVSVVSPVPSDRLTLSYRVVAAGMVHARSTKPRPVLIDVDVSFANRFVKTRQPVRRVPLGMKVQWLFRIADVPTTELPMVVALHFGDRSPFKRHPSYVLKATAGGDATEVASTSPPVDTKSTFKYTVKVSQDEDDIEEDPTLIVF